MKKIVLTVVILLSCVTMMNGQTYTALWKQVKEAEQQDLPRTQYDVLMKIVAKAAGEHEVGQLMKAELQGARVMASVSPDSLLPAVERMEQRMAATRDDVVKTVYAVTLRRICRENRKLEREPVAVELTAERCRQLAAVKATDYEPLVVRGIDSRLFDDDLLSVVGYELECFQPLYDYYRQTGNRQASLLTCLEFLRQQRPVGRVSLKKSSYVSRLDSLLQAYDGLVECGEVAIERYDYMTNYTDATPEERWQYINYALDRWGDWQRMNVLRNAQRDMSATQFNAVTEWRVNIPNRQQTVRLENLRNIRQLTLRVYSVKGDGDLQLDPNSTEGYRRLKPLLTLLPMDVVRQYVGKKEYESFEDSVMLPALPAGVYMVEAESSPTTQVSRQLYYVSDVRVMMQGLPDKQVRYVVVNATTGQPLPGATLRLSVSVGGKESHQQLTTDSRGEVLFKYTNQRPHTVYATVVGDRFCPPTNGYTYYNYYDRSQRRETVQLLTDRALYRPGQTVHAAAIAYLTEKGFEHQVLADKALTLTLRDANRKVIAEQTVTTDRYGAAAADFSLPSGLLNGIFTLETAGGSCSFRVEAYKRPTFEVVFPEVNQAYADGDTVQVRATARSYSGVPVQGAKVSYRVVRRQSWWWLDYSDYWRGGAAGRLSADEELSAGETVTGDDGTFLVDIPMILPPSLYPMFYNFVCIADVTDQGGETHQSHLSLPLGNRTTAFSCDLPEKVLTEAPEPVVFHQRNAAGIDIATTLRYRIDQGRWHEVPTNSPVTLPRLSSGRHTLEAVCGTDTLQRPFVVFSLADKRPAIDTRAWFYQSATEFPADGRPVTVQVGSSDPDVHIVYTILSGNRIVESGAVERSNELLNRQFTYRDEYGNGLLLTFAWVKNGECHVYQSSLRRPLPDKRLKLSWTTFRDRLTPGQQEEWTLSVQRPDGQPADASLVATLYDKSLDQLVAHQWSFQPYLSLPIPSAIWRYGTWGSLWLDGYKRQNMLKEGALSLSHLDADAFPTMWMGRGHRLYKLGSRANGPVLMAKELSAVAMDEAKVEAGLATSDAAIGSFDVENEEVVTAGYGRPGVHEADAAPEPAVQLRENLQETAFFYPRLTTDAEGRVALRFTLPESLTTWRFMGLAHTADLCYGQLEGEAVARKDVMVQPNVPRFVREGDEATVTARVVNVSQRAVSAVARLQLVDPATDKVVADESRRVSVGADATTAVTFTVLPKGTLLVCRVTVSGNGFSDGEQHYLPVLPDRERVTQTVPFTQHGPGVKTVDLTAFRDAKLTFEYTNNPAWLMVQALPTLGQPRDDNAVSLAASLYANSLGRYLVDLVPEARQTFEQWSRETGSETSLHSQLQKNAELRDIVLSETPWVADADRESEQRQRLADFFDVNQMGHRLSTIAEKLQALQRTDGAWSWWPGMSGSIYMTLAVSQMLVRLQTMTGQPQPMLDGAFRFLGREMVRRVSEMQNADKRGRTTIFPDYQALEWLYICRLDGRQLPKDVTEANRYLTSLLRKDRKGQTIYEKAMTAIILGDAAYARSLKEYTVYTDEMGRYYDTPRAAYSWRDYRIPTQVAAIEALQRLTPADTETIDQMRRWLLQQKRTQAWDTPLTSVDAVYAFMAGGQPLTADGTETRLTLDGLPLAVPSSTAGLGYVKTAVDVKSPRVFTAEKTTEGTSWGAVYAQYYQPVSEVRDAASGISIRREIIGEPQVGNRVTVRLTITAERDLDFVCLQDRRAASMEPVVAISGYRDGCYVTPLDNATNYYFDRLPKGKRVVETEYFIDRAGRYQTGTCTVQCAYAPEYRGTARSQTLQIK